MKQTFAVLGLAVLGLAVLAGCGGEKRSSDTPAKVSDGQAASADPAEIGRVAFRACAVCHSVKDPAGGRPQRGAGPNLFGIYGAAAAQVEGFAYSKALRDAGIVWDDETLNGYLENPLRYIPGNRMAYAGERDPERRAALITYLKTLK